MFREGLRACIQGSSGVRLDGVAEDVREALSVVRRENPDILLTSIQIPQIVRTLSEEDTDCKCIILAPTCEEESIIQAMNLGAMGAIQRRAGWDEIHDAIHSAVSGHPALCQSAIDTMIKKMRHDARSNSLTDRELKIMRLVSKDLKIAEMAKELFLAESTVKSHLHNVYSKLGVRSEAGAVATALRLGLID